MTLYQAVKTALMIGCFVVGLRLGCDYVQECRYHYVGLAGDTGYAVVFDYKYGTLFLTPLPPVPQVDKGEKEIGFMPNSVPDVALPHDSWQD